MNNLVAGIFTEILHNFMFMLALNNAKKFSFMIYKTKF